MPKYLITTCPHCKKEFEEKVIQMDFIIENTDYHRHPDGIYTRRVVNPPKPRYKKCLLCQGLINMDNKEEYKYRYEEKNDPPAVLWQRFKRWFDKFLP